MAEENAPKYHELGAVFRATLTDLCQRVKQETHPRGGSTKDCKQFAEAIGAMLNNPAAHNLLNT